MARRSTVGLLGLLILAGSASAATVGDIKGRPVAGRPLEVNIPFAVDEARDRACASASVRYGSAPVPRVTLDVQGRGLHRNLLVTSRANVNEEPVTVSVRVGCGAKAVTRRFVMPASVPAARSAPVLKPAAKQAASDPAPRPRPRPASLQTPGEPLFPPAEALAPASGAPEQDASTLDELRKARAEAAAAVAQLASTRRELAAVLDVERRTQQTLINADHQIRSARSEADRMRLLLKVVAGAVTLAAAGLIWWEFQRLSFRMRRSKAQPAQHPSILSGSEMPA